MFSLGLVMFTKSRMDDLDPKKLKDALFYAIDWFREMINVVSIKFNSDDLALVSLAFRRITEIIEMEKMLNNIECNWSPYLIDLDDEETGKKKKKKKIQDDSKIIDSRNLFRELSFSTFKLLEFQEVENSELVQTGSRYCPIEVIVTNKVSQSRVSITRFQVKTKIQVEDHFQEIRKSNHVWDWEL